MKQYMIFPLLALAGGGSAFVLRLLQCQTGFEAATGLAIHGSLYGNLLIGLLILLTIACCLLLWKLPPEEQKHPPVFPDSFSTTVSGLLALPVMGVFLLAASGALDTWAGLMGNPSTVSVMTNNGYMDYTTTAASTSSTLFQGVLTLLSAACLFPAVAACRTRPEKTQKAFSGKLLLVPVCCLVMRLVWLYRADSVNPVLARYYVELLALVFLTLGFFYLSGFAFCAPQTRCFILCAVAAIVLSIAALADGRSLSTNLFYGGGVLILLGFLLLRLRFPSQQTV